VNLLLEALARGLFVGLVAGVPLGPASAAVVHLARKDRHSRDLALALGAGAALVDLLFCLAATTGVAKVIDVWPDSQTVFRHVGGAVLVILGVVQVVIAREAPDDDPVDRVATGASLAKAFLVGVVISAANPALLSSWVLFGSTLLAGLDLAGAVAASLGAGVGTFGWFAAIALATSRWRRASLLRSAWVGRILGIVLAGYGAWLAAPGLFVR
jgi:threonine/homoserine/homoserine lactone efflux protein